MPFDPRDLFCVAFAFGTVTTVTTLFFRLTSRQPRIARRSRNRNRRRQQADEQNRSHRQRISTVGSWELIPHRMPTNTVGIGATSLSKHKIVVIGFNIGHTFDIRSWSWRQLPQNPIPRYGCAVVCHDDSSTIVVVRGRLSGLVDKIVLDPRKEPWGRPFTRRRWDELPPMMASRQFCGAAIIQEKLVVAGGQDELYTPQRTAEMFDPQTNTWTRLPSLSRRRGGCLAATVDGRMYVFGGSNRRRTFDSGEVLDLATRTWEPLPKMPRVRSFGAAASVGQYILLIGGVDEDWKLIDEVDCFDTKSRKWVFGMPDMHTPRWGCAAAGIKEHVYAFGGVDKYGTRLDTVEMITVDPYYLFMPKLLPLLKKQNDDDLPLGLWAHILAACPASVVCATLLSEKFQLDSVLLHPNRDAATKRKKRTR